MKMLTRVYTYAFFLTWLICACSGSAATTNILGTNVAPPSTQAQIRGTYTSSDYPGLFLSGSNVPGWDVRYSLNENFMRLYRMSESNRTMVVNTSNGILTIVSAMTNTLLSTFGGRATNATLVNTVLDGSARAIGVLYLGPDVGASASIYGTNASIIFGYNGGMRASFSNVTVYTGQAAHYGFTANAFVWDHIPSISSPDWISYTDNSSNLVFKAIGGQASPTLDLRTHLHAASMDTGYLVATNSVQYSVSTVTSASAIYLNMSNRVHEVVLTDNVTFHTTNRVSSGVQEAYVILTASGGNRTVSINSGWGRLVDMSSITLTNNTRAILSLVCTGPSETNVICTYANILP